MLTTILFTFKLLSFIFSFHYLASRYCSVAYIREKEGMSFNFNLLRVLPMLCLTSVVVVKRSKENCYFYLIKMTTSKLDTHFGENPVY